MPAHLFLILFSLLGSQRTLYFDFVPHSWMNGEYTASGNIEILGDHARLAASGNWHLPGWSHRLEFVVRNTSAVQLEEYPVRIDLALLPAELFDIAAIDGADLRLVSASGNLIQAVWLEHFDFIARTGSIWLQLPTLPVGETRIQLYMGSDSAEPVGSWQDVFTYSQLRYGSWWPFPGTAQLSVAGFENARVQVGTADAVDVSGTPVTVQVEAGIIAANGPYSAGANLNASDIPVPFSMAADTFTFPAMRGTDIFEVFSPFGAATVLLMQGDNILAEVTVPHMQAATLNTDVPNGSYRLLADRPVVAYHHTTEEQDGHPLVPASRELWGAALGTVYVSALEDDTTLTVYRSDIVTTTHTLMRDTVLTLSYSATLGSGPALHLVADKPIGALSQADSTGGESVAFLPTELLSTQFILPRSSLYLAIATTAPSTVCAATDPDGNPLQTLTSEATPPPFPNKLLFGAQPAGTRITCTDPVVMYTEDAALGDERHLLSVKDHRPFVYPEPAMEVTGDLAEPRFHPGPGILETPELVVPHRITRWDDLDFLAPTSRPEGTALRFAVSTDDGNTWQVFDGVQWRNLAPGQPFMDPGYLLAGFSRLPATRSLKFRVELEGNGGATPVLGPMAVTYRHDPGAAGLHFFPVQGPQIQGVPFPVTVQAQDEAGRVLAGYDEPLLLSAGDVRMLPVRSPELQGGQATFYVVILDATDEAVIYATDGRASGATNDFAVLPQAAAELQKVTGDGQWGWENEPLPVPLVVRLIGEDDLPLAGHPVVFETETGAFDGTESHRIQLDTNFDGYAGVWFVPSLGHNTVTATHGDLAPVVFHARGDVKDQPRYSARGSTACTQNPGRLPASPVFPLGFLWFLTGLWWLRRRQE